MKNKNIMYVGGIIVFAIVLALVLSFFNKDEESGPGKYDSFVTCLKESGAKFYGAFWCPHCRDQKKLFGASAKLLPYEECSTPNANGQLQVCKDKKIEMYPTWEFSDGSRVNNLMTLEALSKKTSCPINPVASTTAVTNTN